VRWPLFGRVDQPRIPPSILRHARPGWFGRRSHLRSLALLVDHLNPEQRAEFEKSGVIRVVGSDTGRRYAIRVGGSSNVFECRKDGEYIKTYCFLPTGNLPIGDVLLAQKLALELYESEALGVARSALRRR
jgi:hypothetical protein